MLHPTRILIRDVEPSQPPSEFCRNDLEEIAKTIAITQDHLFCLIVESVLNKNPTKYQILVGNFEYWAFRRSLEIANSSINDSYIWCFVLPPKYPFMKQLLRQIHFIKNQKKDYLNC